MAQYVDGFVIVLPKKKISLYKKQAKIACKVWMEYGALDYHECIGEDLKQDFGRPFDKLAKIKKNETVIFAWITYKSKADRNRITAKIMQDPRLAPEKMEMAFDMKKMSYGGFKALVHS